MRTALPAMACAAVVASPPAAAPARFEADSSDSILPMRSRVHNAGRLAAGTAAAVVEP